MEITKNPTSVNFTLGGMKQIRGITIHSMWGTYRGSISWFKNPDAKASAHYLISQEGYITQMVNDSDMAWHAGVYDEGKAPNWTLPNPNYFCLGIEFEDRREKDWPYPSAQRNAGAWLVAMLMEKYNIPRERVILHKDINPSRRSDPVGAFAFSWLFSQVVSENQALEECKKQVADEIKKKNETYQELVEVRNDYEGLQSQIKSYADFQRQLQITLGLAENQPTTILGEVMRLISVQDELSKAQKTIEQMQQTESLNEQTIAELKETVDTASEQIQDLKSALGLAQNEVKTLSKRIKIFEEQFDMEFIKLFWKLYYGRNRRG